MADKVAQTHIHREDGIYFISTINRDWSSPIAPDTRYAETMAWGPAQEDGFDGRGPLVFQTSSAEGSIAGHLYVLGMIHKHGNKAAVLEDADE